MKTIGSLVGEWDVTYATAEPGPSDTAGLTWRPLRGGRLARSLAASAMLLSSRWGLVSVHDPELLPAAIVRGFLRRPTVFDLHEDLPAQVPDKTWVPSPLRRPLAVVAAWMLTVAERVMTVTVAEESYRAMFRTTPPVIANHLAVGRLPDPAPNRGEVVYLGDITGIRGATAAVRFARGAGLPLVMIGRCSAELRDQLETLAAEGEVGLELTGHLDHGMALSRIAGAAVGLSPLHDVGNYSRSLPTKVLEYLAVGIGAVVSDLEGTRSVVGGLPGVAFVPPGDERAWEEAGRDLDLVALREAAVSGVDEVRRRFAWSGAELRDVYRRTAAG